MRIYVDTNVYLDHFYGRDDYTQPHGEFAFQVFQRALACEFEIVMSTFLLKEIQKYTPAFKQSALYEGLKEKRKIVPISPSTEDYSKVHALKKEYSTHWDDAMHILLAQKANAEVIVTRNLKDFLGARNFITVKLPQEL